MDDAANSMKGLAQWTVGKVLVLPVFWLYRSLLVMGPG